jgi:hypothetical protein
LTPTAGENVCRIRTAINQPPTVRNSRGGGEREKKKKKKKKKKKMCILVIVKCGSNLHRLRNGYAKKNQ